MEQKLDYSQIVKNQKIEKQPIFWTSNELIQYLTSQFQIPQEIINNISKNKISGQDFTQLDVDDLQDDLIQNLQPKNKLLKQLQDAQHSLQELTQFMAKQQIKMIESQNQEDESFMELENSMEFQNEMAESIPVVVKNFEKLVSVNKPNGELQSRRGYTTEMSNLDDAKSVHLKKIQLPYDAFNFDDVFNDDIMSVSNWITNSQTGKIIKIKQKTQVQQDISTGEPELILKGIQNESNNFQQINQTQNFTVGVQGVFIGKKKKNPNDIQLVQDSVSRQHSEIRYNKENNNFYLLDQGSKSGTFLRTKGCAMQVKEKRIFEIGFNEIQITSIKYNNNQQTATLGIKFIEGINEMKNKEKIIVLKENIPFYIGSNPDCQLSIPDDTEISDRHAKLNLFKNQVSIEDLGSKKGTWLRLTAPQVQSQEEILLDQDDEIKINPYMFRCILKNTKTVRGSKSSKCQRCNANVCNLVFLPCNHNVFCYQCGRDIKKCPVPQCNFEIYNTQQIFYI